jgi:hypothetical protein
VNPDRIGGAVEVDEFVVVVVVVVVAAVSDDDVMDDMADRSCVTNGEVRNRLVSDARVRRIVTMFRTVNHDSHHPDRIVALCLLLMT